jgi:hypothetical protein
VRNSDSISRDRSIILEDRPCGSRVEPVRGTNWEAQTLGFISIALHIPTEGTMKSALRSQSAASYAYSANRNKWLHMLCILHVGLLNFKESGISRYHAKFCLIKTL